MLEYSANGTTPELTGRESIAFDFIADDIDNAKSAYENLCAQNAKNRGASNDRKRPSTDAPNYNSNYNDNKEIDNDATARARETAFGVVDADPVILAIQRELTGLTVSHLRPSRFRAVLRRSLTVCRAPLSLSADSSPWITAHAWTVTARI